MADCVPGAWTSNNVNGRLVLECDVTADVATNDAYTLKTPARTLDPTRPWVLMVNTAGVSIDDQAVAVDIWAGYDDDFALAGDNGITATSGKEIASAVMDDVQSAALSVLIDPNYTGAKVQSAISGPVIGVRNCGTPPYFAINVESDTTMLGTITIHFVIIQ